MLLLVLLGLSVGIQFAVFGDHSISLTMGMNDTKDAGPSGERIPSKQNIEI